MGAGERHTRSLHHSTCVCFNYYRNEMETERDWRKEIIRRKKRTNVQRGKKTTARFTNEILRVHTPRVTTTTYLRGRRVARKFRRLSETSLTVFEGMKRKKIFSPGTVSRFLISYFDSQAITAEFTTR